ncbi:MAG: dynamin family protein [Moraxellaceae bacterium]|nr:dynamin family protein [Moraxellaceae bacterium]
MNAIVGTEVLPNRNRPMTALPTLIRHTPGQIQPLLKFNNDKPILDLMEKLRKSLKDRRLGAKFQQLEESDKDIRELIALLRAGRKPKKKYEGADAIFDFLKGLNDLVRLAQEVGFDFPFAEYSQVRQLPVIEVEFAHLRESEQSIGRLVLLDTPGPNESGQPHLRKMLQDQLRKASAVLAILDYSQLKSEADAQVRSDLQDIAVLTQDRLFVLVNKFDQKDRNSDGEVAVKSFVTKTLMNGLIEEHKVFPVSSKWGYLANRARHEIALYGKLPTPDEQSWVVDFGECAFGRSWERHIQNAEEVVKESETLWNDSLFHEPLEKVIRTAHARSAAFSLDSAAAKLVDIAEKISNQLNTRETGLKKSAVELQEMIEGLHEDIDAIEASEQSVRQHAETLHKSLIASAELRFNEIKSQTVSAVDTYFKQGKALEQRAYEEKMAGYKRKKSKKTKEEILMLLPILLQL